MRGVGVFLSGLAVLIAPACGGSQPPPKEPVASVESPPPAPPAEPAPEPEAREEPAEKPAAEVPEPEFKEGGSVDEAIKAVPQGTPRLNIETEALAKPLMDNAVYEPCKVGSARFKIRVAVWNGKAVGVDVTTTPNNPALAECIKGRIRELTWPDKVKSLNTVEYQY